MLLNKLINITITTALLLHISSALALDSDNSMPYDITSHSATHDSQKNITVFTGNVVIKQGSTTTTGDDSTILHPQNSNSIKEIITHGNPAIYSTTPKPGQNKIYAAGQTIHFYPNTHLALLIGNASVQQDKNILIGQKILYNTQTRKVVSRSTGKKNQLIIQPHQQGNKP
jgi:lipopolysaccharide export system protein LptA